MANKEHLRILEQGVEAWNQWRKESPDICPCLDGADLRGLDFSLPDPVSRDHPHAGKFMSNLLRSRHYASDIGVNFEGVELNNARLNEYAIPGTEAFPFDFQIAKGMILMKS